VPSLDVFLKGHSGDPIRVDRKGRGPEYIERPALTMAIMVQPDVLDTIGQTRIFRGRGLLARVLYALPTSMVGHRKIGAPLDDVVATAYSELIKDTFRAVSGWTHEPAVLHFDTAALDVFRDLERRIEPQLADGEPLGEMSDWGGKYVGAVARISALLHLAEHGERFFATPVSVETLSRAVRVGEYFRVCAVRAFSEMRSDATTGAAAHLLDRIRKAQPDVVTVRECMRLSRGFKTTAAAEAAIARLIDHGWLAQLPASEPSRPGRRPGSRYAIHPRLWAE
jgi:replicative DNA helicase